VSTTAPRRVFAPTAESQESEPSRLRALIRGREEDAWWARPALFGLLALTAVAYFWNLTASGDANSFYAAAVQAGTKSWKALFFGSLDSSNFITVDKPPASLWVMALSGRIFGFSSLSMLAPQVLEGVAAVGLLYGAVRRWFGAGAGLLAGGVLAVTPVAALMFRFNNPDALLVCLLVAAAYCLTRALERASTRWMVAVGAMIGFAFLAKMMQAFVVIPGFALVYLIAAPTGLRRRIMQLLAGGAAIVVSAGWWVAIVALWPAGSRPMIDGSPDNSILNLIVGYNGLGRIFGSSGPGGGGGGANFSGSPGLLRLFNDLMGGQASWLLPAALLALVFGLWATRRAPRTDRTRAAVILWGGWLIVTALVFSLSSGIIHTYYTVALAPAIAGLVAIGAVMAWRRRDSATGRGWLAAGVAVTSWWSWVLLDRTPQWLPWLRSLILVVGGLAVLVLLLAPALRRFGPRVATAAAVLALAAGIAGPAAYAAQTIGTAHTGSTPSAGPSSSASGMGGFPGASSARGGPGALFGRSGGGRAFGGGTGGRAFAGGAGGRAFGHGGGGAGAGGGGGGAAGGGESVSSALVRLLESVKGYRWVAATDGSQSAASLELATGGQPVMAIGGFNGQGGNLTLAQFEQYVKHGEIRYYIAGGGGPGGTAGGFTGGTAGGRGSGGGGSAGAGGPGGGGSSDSSITSWVEAHFKSETVGGRTVYDLTQAKS